MKFSVQEANKIKFSSKDKDEIIQVYAFIDEYNKCICMVYGEGNRDTMSKILA